MYSAYIPGRYILSSSRYLGMYVHYWYAHTCMSSAYTYCTSHRLTQPVRREKKKLAEKTSRKDKDKDKPSFLSLPRSCRHCRYCRHYCTCNFTILTTHLTSDGKIFFLKKPSPGPAQVRYRCPDSRGKFPQKEKKKKYRIGLSE